SALSAGEPLIPLPCSQDEETLTRSTRRNPSADAAVGLANSSARAMAGLRNHKISTRYSFVMASSARPRGGGDARGRSRDRQSLQASRRYNRIHCTESDRRLSTAPWAATRSEQVHGAGHFGPE